MGAWASVGIYDLDLAARNADTARCYQLLLRRPDMLPGTILHHPLPHQDNSNFSIVQTLALLEPAYASAPPANGQGHGGAPSRGALSTDLFQKMKRWMHVPSASRTPTLTSEEGSQASSMETRAMHDAQDFIINVPAAGTTRSTTPIAAPYGYLAQQQDKDTSMDTVATRVLPANIDLSSAGAAAGVGGPHKRSNVAGSDGKKTQSPAPSVTKGKGKQHATKNDGPSTNTSDFAVTKVRTNVCMSPIAWAIDNVSVDMLRLFLDAPLTQINEPIAYVTKNREGPNPLADGSGIRGRSHIKFFLNPMEYAIAFRICAHIGAHDFDHDGMASIFDDIMDLIMTIRPDFDINHKNELRVGSSVTIKMKKKMGGEPLLHQAIKYYGLYRGAQPINVAESKRLMLDEERMVHSHGKGATAHNGAMQYANHVDAPGCDDSDCDSDINDDADPLEISHVGMGRGAQGKIWCRRHRLMMPMSKDRKRFVSQMQLLKQEVFLRRLIEHEDTDITAVEDVDGGNALHYAVIYGSTETVFWILDNPKLTPRLKDGTPNKLVSTILEHRDNNGYTPLHLAVRCGRFDIAAILVQQGADYYARVNGERAIDVIFQNRGNHCGFEALASKLDELEYQKVFAPRHPVEY